MTRKELYDALDHVNASREKRTQMAERVHCEPELIPLLIAITKENKDPISAKASWVLEFVAKKNINLLLNSIEEFIGSLPIIKLESSIRSAAKICELLVKGYFSKKAHPSKNALTERQLKEITKASFDWLIGEHKVAPKAYSMTTLFLLDEKFDWIHRELQQILSQNYATGSAAYKARARTTMDAIKKSTQNR